MTTATANPPANQLAKQNGNGQQETNGIRKWLGSDTLKQQLAQVLPKHLSPDRQARIAMTALTRTPKLADCDPASFFQCLLTLSQFGLEPDGRHAHLIPFENRKRGVVECQLIIDFKGLAELAMRSGKVSNIHADVVCENDDFDYDRGELKRHKIDFRKPRGEVYAVYALVRFKDGSEKCEVMTREDVESIRRRSKAANSGPWCTDWSEMAKKTVFRRLSKWLPLSPEFRDAVTADDDAIESVGNLINESIDVPKVEYKSKSDELSALLGKQTEETTATGEESQEQPPAEDLLPYWLKVVAECANEAALTRKHEQFDSVRADMPKEHSAQIDEAFSKRLAEFAATTK